MKTLYEWYCQLKERASELEPPATTQETHYEALKRRKKELQIELHQYQQEHKDHRNRDRKIADEVDPMKQKYKEYKVTIVELGNQKATGRAGARSNVVTFE
jgi:chromosome segregation ATPase